MRKIWIEAALNGAWSRALSPASPTRSRQSSRRGSHAHAPAPAKQRPLTPHRGTWFSQDPGSR